MNFLAHIYLSGDDEGVIIGNFIADGIKGKKYKVFPESIQKGILLHRAIDSYTDKHPIVKQSTAKLHKNYGHYSGVIVDILYDHFLAKNWKKYHKVPLETFVENFYELLRKNYEILPTRIQKMMPIMISQNWLLSYETTEGIAKILSQMNIRTKGKSKMNLAILELEKYYDDFEEEFESFFTELISYSQNKLAQL
ncbi:acyl carrier protein phosphodiesterase [Aureisphaera sp. CAU 1614]|uniref:Acyl carrier protein phosphodiesterase n=1 Tax=Halomarinibacterium sedimenti TaxID=2857106 RepID=A0A9X1JV06_9FLAO|nr:acyl carrier protein phosphodiesterase [Halomarinibacterium sedimenti]MBW2937459.1 acyl carrier protein phosphodiesterase [Halomarinibacterium sedimenti]